MKKAFFVLSIILISSLSVWSQVENIELDNLNEYTKQTEGVFYVIIPMDKSLANKSIAETKQIIDQNGLLSVRGSKFEIEDVKLGQIFYLIVRRFNNQDSANSFIESINNNGWLSQLDSLVISQKNYRKFLKKRDLEEYRNFIKR